MISTCSVSHIHNSDYVHTLDYHLVTSLGESYPLLRHLYLIPEIYRVSFVSNHLPNFLH
jgi:hypothetical protein